MKTQNIKNSNKIITVFTSTMLTLTAYVNAQTATNSGMTGTAGNGNTPTDWSSGATTPDIYTPSTATSGGFSTPPDGSFVAMIATTTNSGTEYIQQSISGLTDGQQYEIHYDFARSNANTLNTPGAFDITFGSQTLSSGVAEIAWNQESLIFIATTEIQTLRFSPKKTSSGFASYLGLDNVTITTKGVPEPSSAALLGLGSLGLLIRRNR